MNTPWLIALTLLAAVNLALLLVLWWRGRAQETLEPAQFRLLFENLLGEVRRSEESLRGELARQREESGRAAGSLREELGGGLRQGFAAVLERQEDAQRSATDQIEVIRSNLDGRLASLGESTDQKLARLRSELNDGATQARAEARQGWSDFQRSVRDVLQQATDAQRAQLADFATRLDRLTQAVNQQLEEIRKNIEQRLDQLQQRNEAKLEEMRRTVDEKLESTLERRLGESFKLVGDRLEQVHKGLGEMQAMASSVGDLKRVLTNVKTRGTWGEIQLGALLEQVLTPDQYAANIAPRPGSSERVEFALRLPGADPQDAPVWLPIDAKFPQEDYQRLVEAADRADTDAVNEAGRALELRLRAQARDIQVKYLAPPHTTDFGILFLPSEGLYAEAVRRPGLADLLQREHRIVLAGPTTLAALLNSLQMGFRTLAIQQRSSEVWSLLGAVKTEFNRFGDILGRVRKKLEEASHHIEQTEVRTRAINRKLREVEELPAADVTRFLPSTEPADEEGPASETV